MEKTFKLVITDIRKSKEKEVFEELIYPLSQKGVIEIQNCRTMDEKKTRFRLVITNIEESKKVQLFEALAGLVRKKIISPKKCHVMKMED